MNRDALQTLLQNREPGLMDATGRYAVLVPLAQGPKGPSLLYEVRAKTLRRQPGEVCFPGGRLEKGERPEQSRRLRIFSLFRSVALSFLAITFSGG